MEFENHESRIRCSPKRTGLLSVGVASFGRGGQGTSIFYTTCETPLGCTLIATTAHGLCWVGIHESESLLEAELRSDFPKAKLCRNAVEVEQFAEQCSRYIAGELDEIDLPVDIRATPFQLAVWRELCAIPFGSTRSYGELARRLGRPAASRAVGHANGSNPLAILIPCHRAIGSDGSLTGYRWGVEYKKRLLDHERSLIARIGSSTAAGFSRDQPGLVAVTKLA